MIMDAEQKVVLPGLGKKQKILTAVFVVVGAILIAVLWRGLRSDPNKVPSAFIDKAALPFEVVWLQGQEHLSTPRPEGFGLKDFAGKPVILNFWASWCYSCRAEASDFEAFWQRYRNKGLIVAGIAIQDSPEAARQFAQGFGKTYILGLDAEDGKAAIDYGVTGVPETFFINRQGVVIHKEAGPVSAQLLAEWADQLLQ
ncbi:MAG: TlpA family protein disulfide reductase [Proteobacteria bacterium]|nr:MAG: TlpA family protein disulfide reductase [Pseudomonadota bacterium]